MKPAVTFPVSLHFADFYITGINNEKNTAMLTAITVTETLYVHTHRSQKLISHREKSTFEWFCWNEVNGGAILAHHRKLSYYR